MVDRVSLRTGSAAKPVSTAVIGGSFRLVWRERCAVAAATAGDGGSTPSPWPRSPDGALGWPDGWEIYQRAHFEKNFTSIDWPVISRYLVLVLVLVGRR
jgi:hypothetical protein